MSELLSPAGSPKALAAALEGGADAVYFGGVGFNARKNAQNFTEQEMREAIALAHTYGARVYITQNTLITDRELPSYLSAAESALAAGADALIVADIGGAAAIHRAFPNAELHASTQMSGHSVSSARELAALGFSRMVCAREMSYDELCRFTSESPIEAEVFIHGALCVCHSGQCLFSSVVGGRSGNRGECAQPCRLPYGKSYPLSLKDLALATHIPALLDAKVASFKIEGRMKSPEYVRDVTAIYRRLIDERRAASREEMDELASIFSRGGFTDGYFKKNMGRSMLGTRSEGDKAASRELTPFRGITRKLPAAMSATIEQGRASELTLGCGEYAVTVKGQVPEEAKNAPLDEESVSRSLLKLGSTPFSVEKATLTLGENVMMPISALNALRRSAAEALLAEMTAVKPHEKVDFAKNESQRERIPIKSAYMSIPSQITPEAREYFDRIYLPLDKFDGSCKGVALPPVIFDGEREQVRDMLKKAASLGAEYALVGNIGHVSLAREFGLALHGDLRLNLTNSEGVALYESLGFEDVILSPELTLPQLRDIRGRSLAVVYGRLPLMLLEKCVGRELGSCRDCTEGKLLLCDRRGMKFPVLREWEHRSVIYNSLPTYLADRMDELHSVGIVGEHYIFSTESPDEVAAVLEAYGKGTAPRGNVRRLPK